MNPKSAACLPYRLWQIMHDLSVEKNAMKKSASENDGRSVRVVMVSSEKLKGVGEQRASSPDLQGIESYAEGISNEKAWGLGVCGGFWEEQEVKVATVE